MAELLKRTFPIPVQAVICCGQCQAELWTVKNDIKEDVPLTAAMVEAHIRPVPQETGALTCPVCRSTLGGKGSQLQWKLPTR